MPLPIEGILTISAGPNGSASLTARIDPASDDDWFQISLRAGELYQFQVNTPSSNLDPTLTVRNSLGIQVPGAFANDGGPGVDSLLMFRPTASGTYILDVGAFGNGSTGAYSLVAREVPAATHTYSSVAVGGRVSGFIHDAPDQDYHRVSLIAGQSYIFEARGEATPGAIPSDALPDPTLSLRNSLTTQLAFNDDGGSGLNSRIEFIPTVSGSYYLDVGGFASSTGRYGLTARIDDAADDITTFDSVAVGGSRTGTINSGADQDFYAIALAAGQNYIFDVDGGTLSDPTLSLRSGSPEPLGTQLQFNDDGGAGLNSRIEFTAGAAGTYYLDVGSFGALTGSYTLRARIDDAADDVDTTDSVAVGGSRSGNINTGADQDWYRISLTAGQNYIFDVDGLGLTDPTLSLRNSAGTQLVFNDDGGPGLDSRIEFTAAASGTYYLNVGSFASNVGTYNLQTRIDDVADDIDTTDNVAVNGVRVGTINSGADQDFYRVALVGGQSYNFDVLGGSLGDPTLGVRNAAGTQIAFNDDSGGTLNSHIDFVAPSTGNYYLDVGSFANNQGTYTLIA